MKELIILSLITIILLTILFFNIDRIISKRIIKGLRQKRIIKGLRQEVNWLKEEKYKLQKENMSLRGTIYNLTNNVDLKSKDYKEINVGGMIMGKKINQNVFSKDLIKVNDKL